MKCFVYVELDDDANGHGPPLADAWVYWKEGANRTLLRTDAAGLLLELRPSGQRLNALDYDQPFLATTEVSVSVCYNCFAQPLPDSFLDDYPDAFIERIVKLEDDEGDAHDAHPDPDLPDRPSELTDDAIAAALSTEQIGTGDRTTLDLGDSVLFAAGDRLDGGGPRVRPASNFIAQQPGRRPRPRRRRRAPVAPHSPAPPAPPAQPAPVPVTTNTLVPAPWVRLVLPNLRLEVTFPQELGIWPMLRDPPSDSYLTDGLTLQGAALWAVHGRGATLQVTENEPISTARAAQPPERGVAVRGSVDARVTALRIGVQSAFRGATAASLDLLSDPTMTATAKEVVATLGAPAGKMRPFEASLFFADAPRAFGMVAITFHGTGTPAPIVESMVCQLAGVQIGLVNDRDANVDGKAAGPVLAEANEVRIVDFLESPKPTRPEMQDQTRQRRMIRYPIAVRERPAGATRAVIQQPEMPLWMAEIELLGFSEESLKSLLLLRHLYQFQMPSRPRVLAFDFSFRLHLEWSGPDWGTHEARAQRTVHDLESGAQKVVVGFARAETNRAQLAEPLTIVARGTPAPVQLDFPAAGRRKAALVFDERGWGRAAAAARAPALMLEWQPKYLQADHRRDREIIRGGDGVLTLSRLSVSGMEIDPGIDRKTRIRAASSEVRLPMFRVPGTNPQADAEHLDSITNFLVEEYHHEHAGDAWIQFLHLETWKATLRLILRHESKGMHFRVQGAPIVRTPTALIGFSNQIYGHQHDTPLFGPPHGYGIAQLDDPMPTADQVWSFLENIRAAVELTMGAKAPTAFRALRAHLTPNQLGRAVFQREVVRQYNGGTEFRWNGSRFEIRPRLAQWEDAAHTRPNQRLPYPSQVLGTPHLHYWTGNGASAAFPWPIAFGNNSADFGPETSRPP